MSWHVLNRKKREGFIHEIFQRFSIGNTDKMKKHRKRNDNSCCHTCFVIAEFSLVNYCNTNVWVLLNFFTVIHHYVMYHSTEWYINFTCAFFVAQFVKLHKPIKLTFTSSLWSTVCLLLFFICKAICLYQNWLELKDLKVLQIVTLHYFIRMYKRKIQRRMINLLNVNSASIYQLKMHHCTPGKWIMRI